jgi:hypothetical protein
MRKVWLPFQMYNKSEIKVKNQLPIILEGESLVDGINIRLIINFF